MPESIEKFDIEILPHRRISHYWKEIWKYRELFFFLSWRDLLVQYKQTAIGVLWSILRPVLTIAIFSIVFGKLARLPSEGVPYSVLVFCGMLPWQFFAHVLGESSNSLIANGSLITKVYFPRIVIPTSTLVVGLVDLLISFVILSGLLCWHGFFPDRHWLALPLFLLINCAATLGAGLWFAAWNVKYRDFRYIIPTLVQFGLYFTPVGFSSTIVPISWRKLYALNPLVGVIDGFRWSLLHGRTSFDWTIVLISAAVSALLLLVGLTHFRKVEREFADII